MGDEQVEDIHELSGRSPEFHTELAKQLEELVPEAIADGKVDVAKLKELLAEDAGDTIERFGLNWPGKKRAMRAAQEPTTATLKPAKELSKDWDTTQNIFIEGDNLEVLKVLQKQYHNAVKMIYIDPPYNTGKDFVYPDNFQEGLQNYLEFSKQVDEGNKKISTNTETAGRYHSNWLNMMYPRLKLARNLLTDDGVIFISIDDAEQTNLKRICDEIFGEQNFVNQLLWLHGKGKKDTWTRTAQQYILVYARAKSQLPQWSDIQLAQGTFSNPDNDPRGEWFSGSISFDEKRSNKNRDTYFTIKSPSNVEWTRQWQVETPEEMHQLLLDDRIYFGSAPEYANVPRKKIFPSDENEIIPINLLDNVGTTRGAQNDLDKLLDGKYFDNPKPIELLSKLMSISNSSDCTILDFFSGSATTAHAVMQLNAEDGGNRTHIQVQLPEPTDEKSEAYRAGYRKISDIARERINRAGEKIKADYAEKLAERNAPLDVGYRTYKLADTNFRKWQSSATADLGELQARLDLMRESANDNASEEDLLAEVMLKMGLPLTSRIASREVAGLTVHQVVHDADQEAADVQPVFYLNEHTKPTLEQLRAIVTELTPSKFVILDDAFQGDNELKTNLVQTCKSYDVELWTV